MLENGLLRLVEQRLTCEELKRAWISAFCPKLSPSLKSPDYKPVLWSVFSSGKVDCLQGDAARRAFDQVEKEALWVFYEFDGDEENALLLPHGGGLTAAELEDEHDIYLTDSRQTWTYVHTHEDGFGPYFKRRQPE